ncbi:MAG TPA: GYD domain-containing protein [Thermomicrobiales bacterium]|jgi:uncharacterized protein with GYD domain
MPHYLVQLSYTPEAWAAQLNHPEERAEQVWSALEKIGGRIESLYYAFGQYDVIAILEAPDNTAAAAFGLAITASGAVRSYVTTPLLSPEEGLAAMREGREIATVYRSPLTQTAELDGS